MSNIDDAVNAVDNSVNLNQQSVNVVESPNFNNVNQVNNTVQVPFSNDTEIV